MALLLASAGEVLRATDTTYVVKVVTVDHAAGEIEAKFMVLPEDLRIVCRGEAKKVDNGDYVKVEFTDGKFFLHGTKAECLAIRWYR